MNHQEHGQGQEGTTEGIRGAEGQQSFYPNPDGSAAFAGASTGFRDQLFTFDRENSPARTANFNPFGGILDQLIDDVKKQLVKSRECIVWYREEEKEYQEKLNNLLGLKELQEQQYQEMRRQQELILLQQQQIQQQLAQQQAQSSNNNGGENLAE